MRKLTNKKIRWIIRQLEKRTPVKEIAAVMRVTPRRIYQLRKHYEKTGKIPELKQAGRKPKPITKETEEIILQAYQKYKLKSSSTGKADRKRLLHSHSSQHNLQVLLKHNLVEENMNKKERRKWVRYEREHSMSLW